MFVTRIIDALKQFRDDTRGQIMVETVITLPLLVWALAATYEFFEVHRYKSAREKATYTVADMFSREEDSITTNYMNNTMSLFDSITNDSGANQIRVSIVRYDADTDEYFIRWSQIRGSGGMTPLDSADVATSHATLPMMNDGEDLILVESKSTYTPLFTVGLESNLPIGTRIFTRPRFSGQICWEDEPCGTSS